MSDTALARRCELCKAKPGEECVNVIDRELPLEGRRFHYARSTNVTTEEKEGKNDACY